MSLLRNLAAFLGMLRDELLRPRSTAVEVPVDELQARRDARDEDLW